MNRKPPVEAIAKAAARKSPRKKKYIVIKHGSGAVKIPFHGRGPFYYGH